MNANLDKIEKRIREAGAKEIEAKDRETEQRIEQLKKEMEEEALKAYLEVNVNRKKEIEMIPKRIVSDARMEKKNKIDSKKTEIVERVFDKAKSRILEMSKKEKAAILKSLADNAARNVADPVIYVDRQYADMLDNAKTEELGDFGVIVRSKDGMSSVDNTLESVMNRLQLTLKPAIVKILFK